MGNRKRYYKKLGRLRRQFASRMTAGQIMALGFAAAILAGAAALALPLCNADGRWLAFEDALFSACSAVCVTGLMTVVPAAQFTLAGKVVLLFLIQLGGFGIIACAIGAGLILHRHITLRSRVLVQQGYDLDTMSGIIQMVTYVIRGTLVVEGIGAAGYALCFIPRYGFWRGLGYSVFHAVSAFCNAGIDILGDNSLGGYVGNPLVNAVTIGLIVVSGLGFLVWRDLVLAAARVARGECSVRKAVRKMRLHSKLALLMTLILVTVGAVGVFLMESSNPETLGGMGVPQKWMAALFQSVTTRTAGFFTIPQDRFREETRMLSCLLMFIGGSPGGTAGGVKTTTVALLLATCWSVLKGREDTECFRRRVPPTTIRTGFSVFTVSFLAVLAGTLLLLVIEPFGLMEALYEVVSAVGTVGLTTGITPLLSTPGKLLIVVLMYLGRLSPVTMALIFAPRIGRRKSRRKLPEERIMVG